MMGMAFPFVIGSFSQILGVLWAGPLTLRGMGGWGVTYYWTVYMYTVSHCSGRCPALHTHFYLPLECGNTDLVYDSLTEKWLCQRCYYLTARGEARNRRREGKWKVGRTAVGWRGGGCREKRENGDQEEPKPFFHLQYSSVWESWLGKALCGRTVFQWEHQHEYMPIV